MAEFKDITGMKKGDLIVISKSHKRKGTSTIWNVKCLLCNSMLELTSYRINTRKTLHCGCKPKMDLTGVRRGNLKVVKHAMKKEYKNFWNVQCDCGKKLILDSGKFISRKNLHCGCKFDLTNFKKGMLKITGKNPNKNTCQSWIVKCDCGTCFPISRSDFLKRKSDHCGCKNTGFINNDGYVIVSIEGKKIKKHRYIMQQHLGRELLPEETVHHKNGIKTDNNLDNLELWSKSHPAGQRVKDKVAWAKEILELYGEDFK